MSNPKLIDLSYQQLIDRLDLAMCELAEEKEKVLILHQQTVDLRREKHQLGNRLEDVSEKMEGLMSDVETLKRKLNKALRGAG